MKTLPSSQFKQQTGNVLLLSLILLGAVSILGLSSMRGALVEDTISINIQDQHLATEGAESALRAGERKLMESAVKAGHVGFYFSLVDRIPPNLYTWNDLNSYVIPDSQWGANNPQPAPRFKIEMFAAPDADKTQGLGASVEAKTSTATNYYRIIGYGQGRSDNSVVLEESIIVYK